MMNDQTSPTAGGQRPDSFPGPFEGLPTDSGIPPVPVLVPDKRRPDLKAGYATARPDLLAAGLLLAAGVVLGILGGLAWYRFAPTVWLQIPADAVSQVKSNVDQSSLLVEPEGKGIASVDGYYVVIMVLVGLLLGTLAFFIGRRGLLAGRNEHGQRNGALLGGWAGVLLGGFVASTLAAALGRWVSLPDPLTVLHKIAGNHAYHAPVALHATGLYLAAPAVGTLVFLILTATFTNPPPAPQWQPYGERPQPGYFSPDNPYGLPTSAPTSAPTPTPTPTPNGVSGVNDTPGTKQP